MQFPEPVSAHSFRTTQIHELCAQPNALNLFAGILLGDLMEYAFPETHQAYWALLVRAAQNDDEKELRYALGLPRGFAKTTMMKLFCVWLIIYCPKFKYFLIVSATLEKAESIISDIEEMLSTTNCRAIWGNWDAQVTKDTEKKKFFVFQGRQIILKGLGAEGSVRGTLEKHERPNVILCEDIQEKECAESEARNKKFIQWFVGTLYKARSYRLSMVVYIGNMYNETCLLNRLRQDPNWISLITSALLASGESIWPKFRTRESLIAEYNSDLALGEGAIFLAEVMNDPTASLMQGVDLNKTPAYPFAKDEIAAAAFITIDPALGKISSDDTAIIGHEVIDGKDSVRAVRAGKWGDTQTVEEGLKLALEMRASIIAVEAVAYQATLCNYFVRIMMQRNIYGIHIVPISPKGISKNNRIQNFFKRCLNGENYLHPEARPQIIYQAARFNILRKDNEDDILDAASMGEQVLQEYWHLMHALGAHEEDEWSRAKVLPAKQGSSV